jgi:hypothetical protein
MEYHAGIPSFGTLWMVQFGRYWRVTHPETDITDVT